ncbi:trypsin-like serine protease [Vibrio sp. PNB22_3_1]
MSPLWVIGMLVGSAVASQGDEVLLVTQSDGPVSEAEYQDSLAFLYIDDVVQGVSSLCGAFVVTEDTLITALHCVSGVNDVANLRFTVGQGVDRNDPDRQYPALTAQSMQRLDAPLDICNYKYYVYQSYYNRHDGGRYDGVDDVDYDWERFRGLSKDDFTLTCLADGVDGWVEKEQPDLVIIQFGPEADFVITDSVPISGVVSDSQVHYNVGTKFKFQGWGESSIGSYDTPDVLQHVTLSLSLAHNDVFTVTPDPRSTPNNSLPPVVVPCGDSSVSACAYLPAVGDLYRSVVDFDSGTSGDSGTPVLHDGKVLGVVKGAYVGFDDDGERVYPSTIVTPFMPYLDWIAKVVDSVVAPTDLYVGAVEPSNRRFTIQNLSLSGAALSVGIDNISGVALAHDCPVTLGPLSTCDVRLGIDPAEAELVDGDRLTLRISDDLTIDVLVDSEQARSNEQNDEKKPAINEASAGSSDALLLLGLTLLGFRRR